MQILIVEDEINLAESIDELLRSAHHVCEIVHDGQDALDYALAVPFDLIVMDLMLPLMDGCEVVRELRKRRISTPILMLTARSTVPDKVAGLNAGADDYMTKPFSADELLARVNAMCRRVGTIVMHGRYRIYAGNNERIYHTSDYPVGMYDDSVLWNLRILFEIRGISTGKGQRT